MSVTASDLELYGSLNRPEDDTSTSGGGIDVDAKPGTLQELAANDSLEALSDNAGDTMNLTLTGRDPDGSEKSETKALNGTTVVSFSVLATVERLLKAVLASDPTGTITIRRAGGGATVATIGPGERAAFRTFLKSASESGAVNRYEKLFWKNENGSFALLGAENELTADPQSRVKVGLATAKDDTGSVANRKTAPGGVTFVDDGVQQSVPGTDLGAGEAIGVWIEQGLLASDSAFRSSYTNQLTGTTT